MFRFDHDASRQGVGGRQGGSGWLNHRSILLRMNVSRHRRFTGPHGRDARPGFGLGVRTR